MVRLCGVLTVASGVLVLMLKKSPSVAATPIVASGTILMSSGLLLGAYINRLRKLPKPLVSRMA
ncbi:hypothetical protein CLM71_00450 [Serratia sp. MYb239]|nr:hypothetical protein CLM71_00450 [Serratia sp. MYb239]